MLWSRKPLFPLNYVSDLLNAPCPSHSVFQNETIHQPWGWSLTSATCQGTTRRVQLVQAQTMPRITLHLTVQTVALQCPSLTNTWFTEYQLPLAAFVWSFMWWLRSLHHALKTDRMEQWHQRQVISPMWALLHISQCKSIDILELEATDGLDAPQRLVEDWVEVWGIYILDQGTQSSRKTLQSCLQGCSPSISQPMILPIKILFHSFNMCKGCLFH